MIDPLSLLPLVRQCCRKASVPKQLRDDAEQEGILAVLERLPSYDPALGKPQTHCYKAVMGAIIALLKRENKFAARHKQPQDPENYNKSCYTVAGGGHDLYSDPLYQIAPSVFATRKPAEFDDSLLAFLEDGERDVIERHYFQGQDAGQIAEALGVTRRRVKQLLQSGVETLRLLSEVSQ